MSGQHTRLSDQRNLRLWVAQRVNRGGPDAMVPFHRTLEWLRNAWTTLPGVQQQLAADQLAALLEVARRAGVGRQPQLGFDSRRETLVGPEVEATTPGTAS